MNDVDHAMLTYLQDKLVSQDGTQPFTLQAVITKVDLATEATASETIKQMKKEIFESAPLCLPPILTSCEMEPPFGIDKVRQSIATACGLA